MLRNLITAIRRCNEKRQPKRYRAVLNDDGFDIFGTPEEKPLNSVRWADVLEIRAYRGTVFAYDRVHLDLQVAGGWWIELTEDDDGFTAVSAKLREIFPSIPDCWENDVFFHCPNGENVLLYPRDASKPLIEAKPPVRQRPSWLRGRLSIFESISVACGAVALFGLLVSGRFAWASGAAIVAAATFMLCSHIRVIYDLWEESPVLVEVLREHLPPDNLPECLRTIAEHSYERVVPLVIRAPLLLLKMLNWMLLLIAILSIFGSDRPSR